MGFLQDKYSVNSALDIQIKIILISVGIKN